MTFFDFIMFFLILVVLGLCAYLFLNEYNKDKIKRIDKDEVNTCIEVLNSIIEVVVTYEFMESDGKNISMNKGVKQEITNEDIYNLQYVCETKVIELVNGEIREAIIRLFGEEWLSYHIHIQILSLLLKNASESL